jgi:hypothetical protein
MNTQPSLLLAGVVGLLSAANLFAENAVILEDFEDSIDSVSQGDWGGPRIPDNVTFLQYSKAGDGDINVTHGNKSLKMDLTAEGWCLDLRITLSDDASSKIHDAVKSSDVARYVLRFDVIFPGGTSWMNEQVFLGTGNDQLNTPSAANGGKTTMSIALDLLQGLNEDGPVVLRISDNFAATEQPFVGPLTVYIDNIRLVDTYAPGATPVTTVLQSFENPSNPIGGVADFTGWGGTPRTTYSQYTKTGSDDIRVTEGTHALKVDFAGAGDWQADFTVPFQGTKLAEILKLDQPLEQRPTAAELQRYTFRFDVIYPDRDENGKPAWAVTGFDTLASAFPASLARRDAPTGQVETVSITLDQLTWSDTAAGAPAIVVEGQGDWTDGSTLFFDNFRLIDTGATGSALAELKITAVQFDAKNNKITLQWNSVAGQIYAVDFTPNLGSWPTVLAPNVPGADGTTTYTGGVPDGARGFLRVRPTN